MSIKVAVTDLQTHIIYRGTFGGYIALGKSVEILLENGRGRALRISRIRGWVVSDSNQIYYFISGDGKRFKMRPIQQTTARM